MTAEPPTSPDPILAAPPPAAAPDPDLFELALVMAGAISAGAFTAGVLDFLTLALDEWQADKDRGGADVPPHTVRLSAMAGASAGGMSAAMAAIALGERFEHATDPEAAPAAPNRLYKSWVQTVDIGRMLETDDLDRADRKGQPPRSALSGELLDEIAGDVLAKRPEPRKRGWVADPLQVVMTTTNLRGVPYHLAFRAGRVTRHYMSMHADHVHFEVSRGAVPRPAAEKAAATATAGQPREGQGIKLGLEDLDRGDDRWRLFADVALATGAFPFGFPPRRVAVDPGLYDHRRWRVGTWADAADDTFTMSGRWQAIRPDFPPADPSDPRFGYLAVDGGTTDNEPVELARALLRTNRAVGAAAAVVMIDPFPDATNPGTDPDSLRYRDFDYTDPDTKQVSHLDPVGLGRRIVRSLVNQSRFKPAEVARAADPLTFDQFLVAPSRDGRGEGRTHIACGALGGFSGFLDEGFRRHDYHLGRHNCQSFLRQHFVLPLYPPPAAGAPPLTASGRAEPGPAARHPLFRRWPREAVRRYLIVRPVARADDGTVTLDPPLPAAEAAGVVDWSNPDAPRPKDPTTHLLLLPVVPLRGKGADDVPQPTRWPTVAASSEFSTKAKLRPLIEKRIRAVLGRMIEGVGRNGGVAEQSRGLFKRLGGRFDGWLTRQALYFVRFRKAGDWTDQIVDGMAKELVKEELVPPNW